MSESIYKAKFEQESKRKGVFRKSTEYRFKLEVDGEDPTNVARIKNNFASYIGDWK